MTALPMEITAYGCGDAEAALFRAIAPRLGVTPTITAAELSEATLDLAVGSRCISISHKAEISHATLDALGQIGVRYISTRSIGCNHIDVGRAASAGLSVGTVEYSPDSVADYTLMLILMAIRGAAPTIRRTDAHDYRLSETRGKELRDLTVGVVGTGRIGAAVVDRLRGFGCRVLAHDRCPRSAADHVPLDQLIRQSDVVTLHTPLTADTHHLLDRGRIAQLKRGAVVVNTGRGPLIDTDALLAGLDSGHVGGAALDVLEGEDRIFYSDRRGQPVETAQLQRLHAMPNVLISPHTAYYTDHALSDAVENSIINCLTFEAECARV